MKNASVALFVAACSIAGAASILAQETKMQLKNLPQPVQIAAQAEQARGAVLKGFAKEVEGDKTFYEVETVVKSHTRDLLYDPAGKLVEIEEEIANTAVPAPVMTALKSRGAVSKVESVTKDGVVTYESVVKTKAGKSVAVAVDANGKPVAP
jgi:hypothetical protein